MSRAKAAVTPENARRSRAGDVARLLAAIAADPVDDHARQVYADVLVERGDPRGDFISMQLARAGREPTKAEAKAELALVKKHWKKWLGALGKIVETDVGIGRDYFDRHTRFDRGFLACCSIKNTSTAPRLAALATDPILATVEHLGVPRNSPHAKYLATFETFLERAAMPALRSLEVSDGMTRLVLQSSIAKRLEALRITGSTPAMYELAAGARLSGLRTLWFRLDGAVVADEDTFSAVERALARPTLQRLEVECYQAHASYLRVDGRWKVKLAAIRAEQQARRLARMASGK